MLLKKQSTFTENNLHFHPKTAQQVNSHVSLQLTTAASFLYICKLKTIGPAQYGWHFTEFFFKRIFVKEKFDILL